MSDDDQQVRKQGTFMIIFGWMLALGLLIMLFNGLLDRQHNPNTASVLGNQEGAAVVLQANRNGMYHAEGTVNGYPVEFLLDTGATFVAVPAGIAAEAGMERGVRVGVQTANGAVIAWQSRIDRIQLGNLELYDVEAVILDGLDTDILLGMSALQGLELNQANGILELSPAR